jgi:hypothetical protein
MSLIDTAGGCRSGYLGWGRTTLGWGWVAILGAGVRRGAGEEGPYYGLGYSCPFFYEPPSVRPNRRREFDRLRYQQCEVECGCQPCRMPALGCGGRKIIEERCIANCPKRKKPACVEQNKGWQSRSIAGRAGDSIARRAGLHFHRFYSFFGIISRLSISRVLPRRAAPSTTIFPSSGCAGARVSPSHMVT